MVFDVVVVFVGVGCNLVRSFFYFCNNMNGSSISVVVLVIVSSISIMNSGCCWNRLLNVFVVFLCNVCLCWVWMCGLCLVWYFVISVFVCG